MSVSVASAEEVAELRAVVIALLERVVQLEGDRGRVVERPAAEWMTPKKYAARVGLSPRKIAEMIAAGLPSRKIGRARRVDVAAADAWIKERGTP